MQRDSWTFDSFINLDDSVVTVEPGSSSSIRSRSVVITNELGLHARSAARMARLATEAAGRVWLQRDDQAADATSVIDLLSLICPRGTRVTLMIEEEGDLPVLERLAALVARGFGE